MARKKIIFVIVEGMSDETALGVILTKIFDKSVLYVHVVRGDVTTKTGNNTANIISKVCEMVKEYAKESKYKKIHFCEILHIVDTDGAYILDDCVIQDDSLVEHIYSDESISTSKKTLIEKRNKQKKDNINKLYQTSQIWGLPYSVYYMSCNLDHVLYNKVNLSKEEKENNAYNFAKKYKNDIKGFLDYIKNSQFSVNLDYIKSWEFIKEDRNSLKRNTNLGLVFKDLD